MKLNTWEIHIILKYTLHCGSSLREPLWLFRSCVIDICTPQATAPTSALLPTVCPIYVNPRILMAVMPSLLASVSSCSNPLCTYRHTESITRLISYHCILSWTSVFVTFYYFWLKLYYVLSYIVICISQELKKKWNYIYFAICMQVIFMKSCILRLNIKHSFWGPTLWQTQLIEGPTHEKVDALLSLKSLLHLTLQEQALMHHVSIIETYSNMK